MNNYILNCKSPLLATFHAAREQCRKQSCFKQTNVIGSTNGKAGFIKKKKKKGRESLIDNTSVQEGHTGSSYASEVYSSGAVERANEGIK